MDKEKWYIKTTEYYSAMKRKATCHNMDAKWKKPALKGIYCMIPVIHNVWNKQIHKNKL